MQKCEKIRKVQKERRRPANALQNICATPHTSNSRQPGAQAGAQGASIKGLLGDTATVFDPSGSAATRRGMPVPLLPPPAPAVMPEMPEADTDSQQNSPAQGTCKPQQQQQPGQEQQLGEQLVAQSGKGGMPLAQPAAADVGAVAAVAAEGSGAAVQPAVQPCAAGGKPKADEHDDNTAAALLLGMGSKSESDGGGSAGSSGRNRTKADGASVAGVAGAARRRQLERSTSNGAAAANGAGGKAPDAEDESEEEEEEEEQQQIGKGRGKGRRGSSGSLRRSTRRGRTPAYRASELLGSGSDDEFEPGTKRVPKPAAGMARTPTAAAVPAKSELTLLCERFQQQFGHLQPDGSPNSLMLNDVAEALGVPRRRLYDVINVFESIEVMRRVGKLMYEWVGFDHLPGLLEQLAEDETNGVPVEDRIRRAPTLIIVNEQGEEIGSGKGNSHSLWVLSRRLVRMLLKQEGPIALTAAAAVLVGPGGVSDPSKHRSQTQITVERRLYDIGSILCSVGLLERIYMKKRQPAFDWIYGWRPGDSHDPPKLPNRLANADEDDGGRAEASASRAGRKRAAKAAVAGPASAECDVKKARSAADLSAEAMAAAAASCGIPMGGMPFGMPFGHVMMAPGMGGMAMTAGGAGASPAMFMGGMAGLAPMGDDKSGVMNGMAGMHMAPFFAPPGAFFANPMMQMGGMNGMSGMNGINGMATPAAAAAAAEPSPADPQGASAAGSGAQGDAAMGSVRSGMDEGAAAAAAANAAANGGMGGAPPGMMMWHPQMAMMNPAMMQQYQMQQAAMMKSSDQMQQQAAAAAAAAGSKPMAAGGGMAGGGHFSGGMMMPAGMMMGYGHPMMQPGMMQPNFVPVSAGNNGMQQQQQQQQ